MAAKIMGLKGLHGTVSGGGEAAQQHLRGMLSKEGREILGLQSC